MAACGEKKTSRMTFHRIALVLSTASLVALAACASESDSAEVTADFRGVYTSTEGGAPDAITFGDDGAYLLMPTGCRAEACSEIGTWSIDEARTFLSLTALGGSTRALPVEILATVDAQPSGGSLLAQRLVQPGQETAKTGQETVRPGQQLLGRVDKALVDKQPTQLASAGVVRILQGGQQLIVKPECTQNIPAGGMREAEQKAWWSMCPQGTFTPAG